MTEAPAEPSDAQRDLLEEMQYALALAEQREGSAKHEIARLQRQLVAEYSTLKERVRAAEADAERAEMKAADLEERLGQSLQALRVLRCRLTQG